MHGFQKVVHGLHRVEGLNGHFHKNGDPVGHGAVPQTGQLERFQLATVFRLAGDEAGVGIDVVGEVESFALVIPAAAHQIDGVKVGGTFDSW